MNLYIGLMSGTSLDGVDALLADFEAPSGLAVRSHLHCAMPAALRAELLALNRSGSDELQRAALAANAVAESYAGAVQALLAQSSLAPADVRALGAHGQTVRHRPDAGFTVQLLNGALLAERCGIDVVCDFRSRDVAAHGHGAPLVPAFHAALFHRPGVAQAVLNLGGIANLSLLHADGRVGGFDCGPANLLLDHWAQRHLGRDFDDGGAWAASGVVDAALLGRLLAEPYFAEAPPKSTGRDLFDAAWLEARLDPGVAPADVQATLAELTARCAADALRRHLPGAARLLVCGGGALNAHLMARLQALLPDMAVASTADAGLPPLQVEAAAFAWLAREFCDRRPGNRPEVTGAAGLRILGALYPGR
jgi:anhydro-N-acetylmuramic acid kinase